MVRYCLCAITALAVGLLATAGNAQQYFTRQTEQQCAARGGHITVWTNTPTPQQPYQVGECYVPPNFSGSGDAGASGGGVSYSGGSGGFNRGAAALGAAGAFLGLFATIVDEMQRNQTVKTPSSTYDYYNSPEYKKWRRELDETNAAANRQTSDLQDFIRRTGPANRSSVSGSTGSRNAIPEQCRGYPQSAAGMATCHGDIAGALEEKARLCTDDQCRGAYLRAAASARCTADFRPPPDYAAVAAQNCAMHPGDYQRMQKKIRADYPWADDPARARRVVRDRSAIIAQQIHQNRTAYNRAASRDIEVDIGYYENGRQVFTHRATVDQRCVDDGLAITICDLAWKAKEARDRGWAPTTPFNCDRARGQWEGDIVNGRCTVPGGKANDYDPLADLQRDAKLMQWQSGEAKRLWAAGEVRSALLFASTAEQTFATMIGMTTTMNDKVRAATVDAGLSEIEELAAALNTSPGDG